jgi:glycosyltransferase involved in cell wall biosynthesis
MPAQIHYLQYTNPANYPPLEHSGLILSKAGWDVRYFGIQSEGESNKLTFPEPLSRRLTLWRHCGPGIRQKLHFVAFTLAAFWRAFWQRPAWVYCSDLTSCPATLLILKLTRCKVLYHEHDSPEDGGRKADDGQRTTDDRPPASDLRPPTSGFQRLLLWTRQRVGREADLVVLPNGKRLELFVQTTGRQKRSLCVFNCPRKEEVMPPKATATAPGMLRLAFHGSINRDRLPLAVLEAMSLFPGRVQLSVVGYETVGSKGYMAEFLQTAERLGLGQAVEFVGALPRCKIFQPASKCNVGLSFMPLHGGDVNMANMTGASNKPYDYLACGLALLVSNLPDWRKMFVEPGYGLACNPDDANSIAAQLRWFLEHPAETRAMGERGRQRIVDEWNYEGQFESVQTTLNNYEK